MDRLLCGDVGFGKTEVAMRCAFKAVQEDRQVALLVPTTVLAQQHYDSFLERMAAFPYPSTWSADSEPENNKMKRLSEPFEEKLTF